MNQAAFHRHYAADPFFNMAFDEWLFQKVAAHPGSCRLRLYTWSEGTITFGYNQIAAKALAFERAGSTPVIRRITGGRALYHDPAELTYALAWNRHDQTSPALSGRLSEAWRAIAEALVGFLAAQGIAAAYEPHSSVVSDRRQHFLKAPCFASHARYEITAAGQKIVASASRSYRHATLQHGSIKLHGRKLHPALAVGDSMNGEASSVTPPEFDDAARSLAQVMGRRLELDFIDQMPSDEHDDTLLERLEYVRRNRIERRLIFERK